MKYNWQGFQVCHESDVTFPLGNAPFEGKAIIAFLDLLGFSSYIREKWQRTISPLNVIMDLKAQAVKSQSIHSSLHYYPDEPLSAPYHFVSAPYVVSMSDSFVVAATWDRAMPDTFFTAFSAVVSACLSIMYRAVNYGFAVRGALAAGDVYIDGAEIIGPAFLDAYEAESKIAKTARVILSRSALEHIMTPYRTVSFDGSNLFVSNDGLVALRYDDQFPEDVIKIQRRVRHRHNLASKYDEMIAVLANQKGFPSPDLGSVKQALELLPPAAPYERRYRRNQPIPLFRWLNAHSPYQEFWVRPGNQPIVIEETFRQPWIGGMFAYVERNRSAQKGVSNDRWRYAVFPGNPYGSGGAQVFPARTAGEAQRLALQALLEFDLSAEERVKIDQLLVAGAVAPN
ncbi:hypothetical protein [Sphingomonas sp.]|uniref:hypothetical protein n=1 Tax=Sphingomonas sp. TaxID=28214 RepID=UPI0025F3AA6F|nr:hypothetical protein [Sphingomonas sp.]